MLARFLNLALGIWLMAAPELVGYSGPLRTNHLIVGPVIASIAVIGMWEIARELRWVNLALGVWLVISSLLLPDAGGTAVGVITGGFITAFSLVKGKIKRRVGGGWSMLFRRSRAASGQR